MTTDLELLEALAKAATPVFWRNYQAAAHPQAILSLITTNRELVKLLASVKTGIELADIDLEAKNIPAKTRVKLAASRVKAIIKALSPTQPIKSGEVR